MTALIGVENTHNFCGGRILPAGFMEGLNGIATKHNIPIHLDGARIWNAAAATGISLSNLATHADSLSVCLSKGLGAPAGSLLVGPAAFVTRARRIRKVLGGGMRQIGVIAAAGLQGLDDFEAGMLTNDHIRAKRLARSIRELPFVDVDPSTVETNMVIIRCLGYEASTIATLLKEEGVNVLAIAADILRVVVHRDITDDDIDLVIEAFQKVGAILARGNADAINSINEIGINTNVNAKTAHSFPDEPSGGPSQAVAWSNSNEVIVVQGKDLQGKDLIGGEGREDGGAYDDDDEKAYFDNVDTMRYEEVVVHGMSVSDQGFCVFLRGLSSQRLARVLVTPKDPMADGLDRERAETPEAVTLLQLLQGIDVESYLPPNALASKFPDVTKDNLLKIELYRLVIDDACMK